MYNELIKGSKINNQDRIFYQFDAFEKTKLNTLVEHIKKVSKPYFDCGVFPQPEEPILNRKVWDIVLDNSPIIHSFYEHLDRISTKANKMYGFDIDYLNTLKYVENGESDNNLDWHTDIGINQFVGRKLSFSIIVTDNYEGGKLEINSNNKNTQIPTVIGGIAMFPSFLLHRVTKVKKGTRGIITGMWAGNKPYR